MNCFRFLPQWLLRGGLLLCCFCTSTLLALPPSSFPDRPFVLINSNELFMVRNQLAKPGWKADLYRADRGFTVMNTGRGVRANADLWLHRKIEIPARGGHYHDFFCVEGDRLELPADQRFVPGPYRCPKCGRLYRGDKYEAALRRLMHGWLAQAALDLSLVSAIEDKPDYANKSAEILLAYATRYPGPHTSTVAGGMIYQSLDEAMWVIPLAQAYDLIYPRLAPGQRQEIAAFLEKVAAGLKQCDVKGNWESWHLSAAGVVGYAAEDPELVAWAVERFQAQIRDELGDDGLWPESVHTYHFFPLLAFMHFAEAAFHAGTDLYHWEAKPGKSLLSMFTAPLDYAYPDLRLPAINDGWFESFLPADDYELAFYRTHDPRFAWVVANGYRPGVAPAGIVANASHGPARDGLYAFLFGGEVPAQVTPPRNTSINFPGLGICILRSTNGAMMTFDYGPFLGHGQRDKMGVTLFANGKLWLADYGTPGYGSEILPWYQSTFGHNTIVVDGKNQQPTKENEVKLWLGGADLEAAQSQTQQAYPGVCHTRTVIRIDDYFVIADRLSSDREHAYDLYIHSEGKLSLDAAATPQRAGTNSIPLVGSPWIGDLTEKGASAFVSGRWSDGTNGVALWIGGNAPLQTSTALCPAETGFRKIPLLTARQQATNAEFVTVLAPYTKRLEFNVARDGQTLRITHGKKQNLLMIPPGGARPTVQRRVEHELN